MGNIHYSSQTPQMVKFTRHFEAGKYEPFPMVMVRSLQHALREAGLILNEPSLDKVMAFANHHLSAFPDVSEGLAKLEMIPNMTAPMGLTPWYLLPF
jgi:hypothetical protein